MCPGQNWLKEIIDLGQNDQNIWVVEVWTQEFSTASGSNPLFLFVIKLPLYLEFQKLSIAEFKSDAKKHCYANKKKIKERNNVH